MNEPSAPTRLHRHLAAMMALEHVIELRIEALRGAVPADSEVTALLEDACALAARHRHALEDRLRAVAPTAPIPDVALQPLPIEGFYDGATYPASAALVTLYELFNQAVIGYSILTVLARRAADSQVRGPDNTDEIVQQHLREATTTVQMIARLLPGVVVAELEQDGQECQCSCPSCGLGICLCAVSTRRSLEMAWTDAGPIYTPEGIVVVRPRSASAAARAGLRSGDIVLAVDDKAIESLPMLQDAIRNHTSGEEIRFRVRLVSGEQVEITAMRP